MSRIWTAITLEPDTGKCDRVEFAASYDYATAVETFHSAYPCVELVAVMPGMRPECQTFHVQSMRM